MTHKPKMIVNITTKFTIKTLPIIEIDLKYKGINEMMKLLYTNEVTLPTPQGGGHHGYIVIIMNPTLYTTLFTT